ncbi:MAG: hypothetical protein ABSH50_29635 [Bryobacteraceae bacterium]|jgi:hypothetical protein
MTFAKTHLLAAAAVALACFGLSTQAFAATATNITFNATGTFASVPVSGSDTLKLAGEPFNVTIVVSSSTKPYKNGPNYAVYNKLKLTGEVNSGLLGPTPAPIASSEATIQQAIDPGKYDQFIMEAPIKVIGVALTLKAVIVMPLGTIANQLLQPFTASVSLAPSNATLTYSDSSASTELGIQTGTLSAK